MAKQHTYTIGPVTGIGRTKTEAREHAERTAAEFAKRAERGPVVVRVGNWARIISPTVHGWEVRPLMDDGEWRERGPVSMTDGSLQALIVTEAVDLAKMNWDEWDDSDNPHPDAIAYFDDYAWSEWRSFVRFHRTYRARYMIAKQAGLNDSDAREYAGQWIGRRDLQERVDAALACQAVA